MNVYTMRACHMSCMSVFGNVSGIMPVSNMSRRQCQCLSICQGGPAYEWQAFTRHLEKAD